MSPQDQYISVSQLIHLIRDTLSKSLPLIHFQGEISSVKPHSKGMYLTLKDENSSINAVLWDNYRQKLQFQPEVGMHVLCRGTPNLYAKYGSLQISIINMRLAGEGDLQKKFLELKEKLEKEGLFDRDRKRPLPFFPKDIGIITSASGAVIHDMKVKIEERMPGVTIHLYNSLVQGAAAAKDIVGGIKYFNEYPVDVLIVARGGGSLEELWCFNEENVVRAIFSSKVPVISGVGHEPDVTLTDLVADYRAPTPTAAAEKVVPEVVELSMYVKDLNDKLNDFEMWFYPYFQDLDELVEDFEKSSKNFILNLKDRVVNAQHMLKLLSPNHIIKSFSERLDSSFNVLRKVHSHNLKLQETKLNSLQSRLSSLNPERVLERGYAIVKKDNHVVTNSNKLSLQDAIDVRFAKGSVSAIVDKTD